MVRILKNRFESRLKNISRGGVSCASKLSFFPPISSLAIAVEWKRDLSLKKSGKKGKKRHTLKLGKRRRKETIQYIVQW